jgi:hypothetical protein
MHWLSFVKKFIINSLKPNLAMAELLENLVSVEITDDELAIIEQALDIMEAKMPFLISLTPAEIKALFKLHDGNRPFCEAVLTEMKLWKKLFDASLSVVELEKDLNFTKRFVTIIAKSGKISERLSATFTRSGAEGRS